MRVQHNLSSSFYARPLSKQSDSDTTEGTPFVLTDRDENARPKVAQTTAASSNSGASSSISNALWLSQLGMASQAEGQPADEAADTDQAAGLDETAEATDPSSAADPMAEFARLVGVQLG